MASKYVDVIADKFHSDPSPSSMHTPTEHSPAPGPPGRGVRFSTPAFLVLLGAVILPWALIALSVLPNPFEAVPRTSRDEPPDPGPGEVRSGPWGKLEMTRIAIAPMDVGRAGGFAHQTATEWMFEGHTPETLTAFLSGLSLTREQQSDLLDTRRWGQREAGILVKPSDATILSLEAKARLALYDALGVFPVNEAHHQPWSMLTENFGKSLELSDLAPHVRDVIRKVAYPRANRTFVSDVPVILNALGDEGQKRQALRFLRSASTYLVDLVVPARADADGMIRYWGERGRRKDLRPIIESLGRLPAGGRLDIAHLLPAFARQRLYIYPDPALAQDGVRRDCHWTSLNFWASLPDNRFGDPEQAQQQILDHYYRTEEPPGFGDVLFFTLPNGDTIHSAVHLAAGLAFTKNGDSLQQPWIIMDVEDIRDLYGIYHRSPVIMETWRAREK